MILLDRGRILKPQKKSSQRASIFGIEDSVHYRVTAYLDDGHIVWRGWFDDCGDADAFLLALVSGSLANEKALWSLTSRTWTPREGLANVGWSPDIGAHVRYEFKTQVFLTALAGQLREYRVPDDWVNPDLEAFSGSPSTITSSNASESVPSNWGSVTNTIECVGGGGGGSAGTTLSSGGMVGGGGGAYSLKNNVTLTPGGTINVVVGGAGTGGSTSGSSGTDGGDTYFNGASLAASSCGAEGGDRGVNSGATSSGGAGGTTTNGVGDTKYAGGSTGGLPAGNGGSGGGGAAGPRGAGGAGGTNSSNSTSGGGGGGGCGGGGSGTGGANGANSSGGTGGAGGNNSAGSGSGAAQTNGTSGGGGGGSSGSGVGGNGGAGSETAWGSGGCGGGGGGCYSASGNARAAGNAGNYGGGGGGGGNWSATWTTGGNGAQGIIAITYTPAVGIVRPGRVLPL